MLPTPFASDGALMRTFATHALLFVTIQYGSSFRLALLQSAYLLVQYRSISLSYILSDVQPLLL